MGVRVWGSHISHTVEIISTHFTLSLPVLGLSYVLVHVLVNDYAKELIEHLANIIFRSKEVLVDCVMPSDKYLIFSLLCCALRIKGCCCSGQHESRRCTSKSKYDIYNLVWIYGKCLYWSRNIFMAKKIAVL